jgi:hypothetical protein
MNKNSLLCKVIYMETPFFPEIIITLKAYRAILKSRRAFGEKQAGFWGKGGGL